MKAITLYQPWASLVAWGFKWCETRSWGTAYRGPIAVHAAARRPVRDPELWRWIAKAWPLAGRAGDWEVLFPLGKVVAVARLAWVVPAGQALYEETVRTNLYEAHFGDFGLGRFAWRLEDVVRKVPPVPAVGRQRIWNWDEKAA